MATYEIIIKNQGGSGEEQDDSNIAGQGSGNKKPTAKGSKTISNALKYVSLTTVKELVISKVGAVTRNNLLQRKIDTGINIALTIGAFAVNPAFGAINLVTSVGSQLIDYGINMEKEQHRNSVLWQRAGYLNRSRE